MKKIKVMHTAFRDGFQSCLGARVKTEDFIPALEAAVDAGGDNFEIGGGARFQSVYFYCQEDAFDMMDACRVAVGPDINLQTLARGANVVGLISQSRDVIDLHAKMFKKHGITTIRNFDALNDYRNLAYSGSRIHAAGIKHQVVVAMMGLPPELSDNFPHTPEFYIEKLQDIIKNEIPYDSVCFKDASGTSNPSIVYKTIKEARKILPEGTIIQFHTHDTAGMAVACNMAAIEAGADIIDLALAPCSGGTGQADLLTMWHRLKGTDYTLDIDHEKWLEVENIFTAQLEKYFIPPEAKEVSPIITFSPMPGGALTANTQMMRDNNCLELFPEVIKNMREVVAKGGFGTSVTPVSQFYFQQAFANTMSMKAGQDKWAKISDSYGKMVLGYFGKTPAEPDAEIVKLASEQLGLEPTSEDVHDINDNNPALGLKVATEKLKDAGLEVTDENLMIAATCSDKGIAFLKGDKPLGIRYKTDMEAKPVEKKDAPTPKQKQVASDGNYSVTVDGKTFTVQVTEGGTTVAPVTPVTPAISAAPVKPGAPDFEVTAPMPGNVVSIEVEVGSVVESGDAIVVMEAMKMETHIKTEKTGTVVGIEVEQGDTLASGDVIAIIEEGA